MILTLVSSSFKYFERVSPLVRGRNIQAKLFEKVLKISKLDSYLPYSNYNSNNSSFFKPEKALVLTKFSRYEYEKRRHPALSEEELMKNLADRGSDYSSLIHHHSIHMKNRDSVIDALRYSINLYLITQTENIEWADVVFTTGGDGTFLMAASKIINKEKPVIGVNSDPSRSIGYLCLPAKYTNKFEEALKKLLDGKFTWSWRQRIRIHMQGKNAFDPPIELHDQQLLYPEYRFIDCYNEGPYLSEDSEKAKNTSSVHNHSLPVRALNEVFIGESLSSRTSYYEVSVNGSDFTKQRSSGLTVSTGTGSTSWHLNTNMLTRQDIFELLKIIKNITGKEITEDDKTIHQITDTFNGSLIFEPSKPQMAFTIRDAQHNVIEESDTRLRGFANEIKVKSRCFDACLVIDGGLSFAFNDGATAEFSIFSEDALKTAILDDADIMN
ncbi:NAD kinase 2, mitochondrial [Nymphon striatum]|nr:NAD kinase 2, mitochondrial [Nymphon striatum]